MKKVKLIAVLLLLLLVSCSAQSDSLSTMNANTNMATRTTSGGGGGGGGRESASAPNQPNAQKVSLEQSADSQAPPSVTERKIIRDADLQLESASPEETQQKIAAIVESKGGFIVQSTQSSSSSQVTTRDTVSMTARVPAEKFSEAINEIRQSASRVVTEKIEGKDVTEEFVDVQARLRAKKALEEQFLEIMKRANSVEDALNVQRQLGEVRSEIEQIEGRLRYLENQTSLSTIKVSIRTPTAFSPSSSGFIYQLGEAINRGFDVALSFVLALITIIIALLPFFVFIVLPLGFLIRYFIRKNRRQKLASEIAREEISEQ